MSSFVIVKAVLAFRHSSLKRGDIKSEFKVFSRDLTATVHASEVDFLTFPVRFLSNHRADLADAKL